MGIGQTGAGQLAHVALLLCSHSCCALISPGLVHGPQAVPSQHLSKLGPALSRKPSLFQGIVASLLLALWPCDCHLVPDWVLFGLEGYLSFPDCISSRTRRAGSCLTRF